MTKPFVRHALAAAAMLLSSAAANATFTINLNFTGGLSVAEQGYFTSAKTFWEGLITGYQAGISLTGFTISASGVAIDGVSGVLGSAGPSSITTQGGFTLTTAGAMEFDTADIANMISNGSFTDVIKHEMGHVIGFGTLWNLNNVYTNGTGQYTGAFALANYKTEFVGQGAATSVPVELGGGSGTADGHWDEVNNGAGLTGRVDANGRDMRDELMTGWLNAPTFISKTTVASFQDIGYTVNLSAVPEPETLALWLAGVPMLATALRRRRQAAAAV